MIPRAYQGGEIAVIGLAKSGLAAATLLAREGGRVYASDSGSGAVVQESAASLRALGVDVETEGHDLARIARARLVVASPGVPPAAPPLRAAVEHHVPVVGELEVALWFLSALRYIAITGTNGKTTTTALTAHLFRALGLDGVAAGNIGTPLADVALGGRRAPWVALEVSSFQLHDTPSIRPDVGVVTNLSANHLDRYDDVEGYYGDKALLFRNMHPGSRWVLNGDEPEVLELSRRLPAAVRGARQGLVGATFRFSLVDPSAAAYYDRASRQLMLLGEPLLSRDELTLIGDHNVANALTAALAVAVADPAHRTADARRKLADGLRSFRALAHRIEPAGEFGGVLWINDSKSTNVASTIVALEGMTRPTILLLGGRHKGEPYTALSEPLRRVGKTVLAYGESARIIEQDLGGRVALERVDGSFEEVVARARALASPGDAVLLSPACSSYDMFNNYEERGAEFKRLAAAGARREERAQTGGVL
jgi:UDP-N-acetylmuramoylalanine--D-glutamate ligase